MDTCFKETPGFARTMLAGLVIECPRLKESKNCSLREKRKQPFADKFNWVTSLSDDELVNTYAAHCKCLKTKEI